MMSGEDQKTAPRRFYESVAVEADGESFAVLLDGRSVRTPARATLAVSSEALARRIAAEWEAQGEKIDPATMPMTKRANTALDRVRGREDAVASDIMEYAGTDLLCYRAEGPESLAGLQAEHWDPVLAWVEAELSAPFEIQAGIVHVPQPEGSLARVRAAVAAHDFYALTPLHTMTTLTGSALLALAHAHGRLDADEVWAAAHVDEDWQMSLWGEDAEAMARRAARREELDADSRFLALVRSE